MKGGALDTPLQAVTTVRRALVERFDAVVFDRRNLLAALPVVVAWLAAPVRPSAPLLAAAAASVAAGAALRAWATLYNRYAQGESKALATGGPYSWSRNPLYWANGLVLLGGFVASGLFAWLPAAVAWFALVYERTVRHEERRLAEKYGAAYAAYSASVPRWLPARLGERPHVAPGRFLGAFAVQARVLLILAPFLLR